MGVLKPDFPNLIFIKTIGNPLYMEVVFLNNNQAGISNSTESAISSVGNDSNQSTKSSLQEENHPQTNSQGKKAQRLLQSVIKDAKEYTEEVDEYVQGVNLAIDEQS